MQRRRAKRFRKRLACSLQIDGRHHSGVVLDISATGLFVQTNAKPEPGTPVSLEMSIPGSTRPLFFQAVVARQKLVPPQLVTVAKGGLGLLIQNAPEDWYAFIADVGPGLGETDAAPSNAREDASPTPPGSSGATSGVTSDEASGAGKGQSKSGSGARTIVEKSPSKASVSKENTRKKSQSSLIRFRLRLSQAAGSRSRSIIVSATTEAEARRLASDETGAGWKIIECSPATDQSV